MIYFLKLTSPLGMNFIKAGYTTKRNYNARMRSHKRHYRGYKIEPIGRIDGDMNVERSVHNFFKPIRLKSIRKSIRSKSNEVYLFFDAVEDFIKKICTGSSNMEGIVRFSAVDGAKKKNFNSIYREICKEQSGGLEIKFKFFIFWVQSLPNAKYVLSKMEEMGTPIRRLHFNNLHRVYDIKYKKSNKQPIDLDKDYEEYLKLSSKMDRKREVTEAADKKKREKQEAREEEKRMRREAWVEEMSKRKWSPPNPASTHPTPHAFGTPVSHPTFHFLRNFIESGGKLAPDMLDNSMAVSCSQNEKTR